MWPSPILTPASFGFSKDKLLVPAKHGVQNISQYLFREDSFDPVTKIRRGRFYKKGDIQPDDWTSVVTVPGLASPTFDKFRADTFISCSISDDIVAEKPDQRIIVLGTEHAFSLWTVVANEIIHSNEVLFTLRARSGLGALPQIDWNKVPNDSGLLRQKVDALSDDIYRAGPESVVDRAREAATAILSLYLAKSGIPDCHGKELFELVKKVEASSDANHKKIVTSAAEITRILHSRAKYSVRTKLNTRPIKEQDAELAVQCIGVMLCDIGWANWG